MEFLLNFRGSEALATVWTPVNLEMGGKKTPGATVGCCSAPSMKSQHLLCGAAPVSCQTRSLLQHRNRLCSQLYHRLPASVWKKITEKHIWKNVTHSAPDIWSNTWPSSEQRWTLQTLLALTGALLKSRPDGQRGWREHLLLHCTTRTSH